MFNKELSDNEIEELLKQISEDDDKAEATLEIFDTNGEKKLEKSMICYDIKRPDFATRAQLDYLATLVDNKFEDLRIKLNKYRNCYTKINLPKHPIAALRKEEYLRSVDPLQFCYELFSQDINKEKISVGFLSFKKQIPLNGIFNQNVSIEKLEHINQPDSVDLTMMNQTLVNPIINCINNVIKEKLGNDSPEKIASYNFIPSSKMQTCFIGGMSMQGAQLDFDVTLGNVKDTTISIYLYGSLVKKIVAQYITGEEVTSPKEDEYSNPENAVVSLGTFKWKNGENVKKGNILELTKLCHENVDIVVNEKCVAKGEVRIVSDHLCVVIT